MICLVNLYYTIYDTQVAGYISHGIFGPDNDCYIKVWIFSPIWIAIVLVARVINVRLITGYDGDSVPINLYSIHNHNSHLAVSVRGRFRRLGPCNFAR